MAFTALCLDSASEVCATVAAGTYLAVICFALGRSVKREAIIRLLKEIHIVEHLTDLVQETYFTFISIDQQAIIYNCDK